MDGLKWPVENCVNCGKDLTEVIPHPREKSLSEDGSGGLKWSDFCPVCGRAEIVGDRVIPVPRTVSTKVITSQAEILASAPGARKAEAESTNEFYNPDKPQGPQRTLKPSEFWCTKCAVIHRESSKQGSKHLKYKEV